MKFFLPAGDNGIAVEVPTYKNRAPIVAKNLIMSKHAAPRTASQSSIDPVPDDTHTTSRSHQRSSTPKQQDAVRTTPYSRSHGRWRKRPNHEIEYLRQQVTDLEAELAVLRQPDTRPNATEMLDLLEDCGGWESIAKRQKHQADAVLMQNVKLRAMLEGQLRVARALEAAIDQHARTESSKMYWCSRDVQRPRASSLSDELLFGLLDDTLESLHACIDQVMDTTGVAGRPANDLCPELRVEQDVQGISFHHGEVRLLPFPTASVLRAICSCLTHGEAGGPIKSVAKLVKHNDCLRATIVDTLHLPKEREVRVKSRVVQRYFIEPGRSVLVWAAYVEIEGSVFVRLEEKGWVAVEPYEFRRQGATVEEKGAPGSCLRCVARVTPIATEFNSDEEEQQHRGEMTDLVVGTYHRNFGLFYQVLENLLMNDMIAHDK